VDDTRGRDTGVVDRLGADGVRRGRGLAAED